MKNIIYLKEKITDLHNRINILLLLLIILISNSVYSVKLAAVVIGIVYIAVIHYPLKVKGRWKEILKADKTIWFYISMIGIGLINLTLDFSYDYSIVVCVGIFFWCINILIHKGTLFFIHSNSYDKILNTLKVFVILNFILSVFNLVGVMIATNSLVPYAQMMPPPYGGMSGDLIQGFFMKEHLPNSCISTLLFIYFITIKQYRISLISLTTLLLASSSLCTLIVVLFLIPLFVLGTKKMKYFIVLSFGFILVFYIKINPFNYYEILKTLHITETNQYEERLISEVLSEEDKLNSMGKNIDSLMNKWEHEQLKPKEIVKSEQDIDSIVETWENGAVAAQQEEIESKQNLTNINETYVRDRTYLLQQRKDSIDKSILKEKFNTLWETRRSTINELNNSEYFEYGKLKHFDIDAVPGMIISFKQTKEFLEQNPKNIILGNGMGNFSSVLAFTSCKEGMSSRLFKTILPKYEHPDFTENHKALWKYVTYKGDDYRSIKHYPYNTYNTLLGEYGILGLLSFLLLFIAPIIFKLRKNIILLLIMIPLFMLLLGTYYWFETFLFIVFFELIIYNEMRKFKP